MVVMWASKFVNVAVGPSVTSRRSPVLVAFAANWVHSNTVLPKGAVRLADCAATTSAPIENMIMDLTMQVYTTWHAYSLARDISKAQYCVATGQSEPSPVATT